VGVECAADVLLTTAARLAGLMLRAEGGLPMVRLAAGMSHGSVFLDYEGVCFGWDQGPGFGFLKLAQGLLAGANTTSMPVHDSRAITQQLEVCLFYKIFNCCCADGLPACVLSCSRQLCELHL
jgi:hypothetical protein